jgi:hypothetical protein
VSIDEAACRRCEAILHGPAEPVVTHYGPARVCQSCGWINQAPEPVIEIDLDAAAVALPDVFDGLEPPSEETASAIARYAEEARTRVVTRIGTEVLQKPAEAVTWLCQMLKDLYKLDQMFSFDGMPVLAIQQVYLHFLAQSAVPIFEDPVPLQSFWGEDILSLVNLWRKLSGCLREARLGRGLQLNAGRISLPPTEISSWASDVNANLRADSRSWWLRSSPQDSSREQLVEEAEFQAFGVSVIGALAQMIHVEDLRGRARFEQWEDWLILVDLGEPTPPELQQLFRRFMLSRRRLSQQVTPDFLFPPEAPARRSTADALAESAEFDWLQYAPVLLGIYGDHIPVAIISPYLLYRAFGKAKSGIARRLVVAENEARRSSPDAARATAALSRQVHAQLEADTATCFREAGMTAVENLASVDGRSLDCGEIDVLATTTPAGRRPVVVVCEVKDTDLSFFKDWGPEEAYSISEKGRRQAQRKAAWVAAHWDKVCATLGLNAAYDASEAYFVALVVPRVASLPIVGPGPASVGLPDLAVVARALAEAPFEAWRPDLMRAVVQLRAPGRS